ncbi:MAG: hypothetical protein HOP28_05570, partial [Gemmatimonadales bacterium]|nr:hypothetical protein [Gemmatimonadales bacterium]
GKIYFQRLLDDRNGQARGRLAKLSLESETSVTTDLNAAAPIEVYLPVPEHRRSWTGGPNVLVATAEEDDDAPIAYDLTGRRQRLDPKLPPGVPVIALVRAEQPFGVALKSPGSAGGPAAAASINTPGLHMTYAAFVSTFEGWLKGGPEFEVHILGQDGTSSAMESYQCAGAKAGGPYEFDQNSREWNGRVLLFSQAQFDSYAQTHPGQAVRVFVLEDDDGACDIKMDSTRVANFFQQLRNTYGDLTGGKDKQQYAVRMFQNASSLLRLFRSAWSFITTQDDLVGNAIEDVVAREFYPGANWVVKGANNETYGALRLEMR